MEKSIMRRFILGLDEGTTSLRAVLYDVDSHSIIDKEGKKFKQFYPQNGWVEQDAEEIYKKILSATKEIIKRNGILKEELLGIGITNQRETVVAWDRKTGKPIYNAIVWQCRRTSKMFKTLSQADKQKIKEKTGLIANPYFSASKISWILENVKEARTLAKKGELCFGTIDSFLAFRLSGNHVTDTTNASRTCLMNIETMQWDDELLDIFKIPKNSLPQIMSCDANFGNAKQILNTPIVAMIGDQQSSMIGQGAIEIGNSKVTYGTGGFVLININSFQTMPNLLTTVARTLGGKTEYAIEGSIYSACSAINWLENLGMFEDVGETAKIANSLQSNEGVYFVPAFTGLGAPYWKDDVRAEIVGMSFDTTKKHIIRACLESMAYNTKAIVDEMRDYGQRLRKISVDGGGSRNEFLLQFLADMLGHEVVKSTESEATVMGAIYVAMMSLKLADKKDIKELTKSDEIYTPKMTDTERNKLYEGWKEAIRKMSN